MTIVGIDWATCKYDHLPMAPAGEILQGRLLAWLDSWWGAVGCAATTPPARSVSGQSPLATAGGFW